LRTTKITLNRITICIMNLWVNRLRQLAPLAVALFFFACEDDSSLLGYKNPNPKFEGKYIEIPLSTSVLYFNDIRPSNYHFNGEYNRFLLGRYEDPNFGNVQSNIQTQFFPNSGAKLPESMRNETLDKLTLDLALDLYYYGPKTGISDQTIQVYQIDNQQLLGEATFSVDPTLIEDHIARKKTSDPKDDLDPIVVSVDLNLVPDYGKALWDSLWDYSFNPNTDSTFILFSKFSEAFKGIEIKSSSSDKFVLGISIATPSRMVLHYADSLERSLVFSYGGMLSKNLITLDKGAGDLASLVQPFTDYPLDGKRYVQAGTGIMTKLNLDEFYQRVSHDSMSEIMINSAQLVIDSVVATEFTPPAALALRALNDDNTLRKLTAADLKDPKFTTLYGGILNPDFQIIDDFGRPVRSALIENDSTIMGLDDEGRGVSLGYSTTKERYSGFFTLFFQRLYKYRNEPDRYRNFVLYPTDPAQPSIGTKSVNRAIFSGKKVVLRIFYTNPTVKQEN
jgi:hypothetical protein